MQNPCEEDVYPIIKPGKGCEWGMFKGNINDQKSKKYSLSHSVI